MSGQAKPRPKISAPVLTHTSSTVPTRDLPTREGPTRLPSYNTATNDDVKSNNDKKKRANAGIDVIDNLDPTASLFAGGVHHAGPFDAASAHRNRPNARAPQPMGAFNKPPTSSNTYTSTTTKSGKPGGASAERGNAGVSARAQAALAAMSISEENRSDAFETLRSTASGLSAFDHSTDNLLASSHHNSTSRGRRNSDGTNSIKSVHLGFPTPYNLPSDPSSLGRSATTSRALRGTLSRHESSDSYVSNAQKLKAAKYAEAFGLQDAEAWEDYGRSAYAKKPPRESLYDLSNAQAREARHLVPKGLRAERAASVWDMEATLREGVPVGSAPPVPSLPSAFVGQKSSLSKSVPPSSEEQTSPQAGGSIKRSKSLMQRLKKARQNPMVPMNGDDEPLPLPHTDPLLRSSSEPRLLDVEVRDIPARRPSPTAAGQGDRPLISAPVAPPLDPAILLAEPSPNPSTSKTLETEQRRPAKASPTRTTSLGKHSPVAILRKQGSFDDRTSVTMDVLDDFDESKEDYNEENDKIEFTGNTGSSPSDLGRKRSLMRRLKAIG